MSGRRLAVVMDPIESIDPHKDSTLPMLLEAQARGWTVLYARLDDIWLRDGEAHGGLTQLEVSDDPAQWFAKRDVAVYALADLDIILMRKDPPFDLGYIVATYILDRAEDAGALVVNRPRSLRDANEKAWLAWFPECAPPTLISRSLDEMRAFLAEHGTVVVKPLDLMGGRSVFVTDVDDGNHNVILEMLTERGTRYAMAQQYRPEVVESGDKRIFLIDGEPVSHALVRMPPDRDHRCNLNTGGRAQIRELTDRDMWICNKIGPTLRAKGLWFAGIDVIGDYVTEINVTSATGIRELERGSESRVTRRLFDFIASKLG